MTTTRIDLGSGQFLEPVIGRDNQPYGWIRYHACVTGLVTGSMVTRRGMSTDGRDEWDVLSEDPLTLSPSLKCRMCGSHGFVRSGKWEPA